MKFNLNNHIKKYEHFVNEMKDVIEDVRPYNEKISTFARLNEYPSYRSNTKTNNLEIFCNLIDKLPKFSI